MQRFKPEHPPLRKAIHPSTRFSVIIPVRIIWPGACKQPVRIIHHRYVQPRQAEFQDSHLQMIGLTSSNHWMNSSILWRNANRETLICSQQLLFTSPSAMSPVVPKLGNWKSPFQDYFLLMVLFPLETMNFGFLDDLLSPGIQWHNQFLICFVSLSVNCSAPIHGMKASPSCAPENWCNPLSAQVAINNVGLMLVAPNGAQ